MKTNSLFLVLIFSTVLFSQNNLANIENPPKPVRTNSAILGISFEYDGNKPWENYDNYSRRDEKIFGKQIAQQFSLLDHYYVVFPKSGNDYKPTIIKPAIYGSITKLKQHYKSQFQANEDNDLHIKNELKNLLIIVYLCYSEDTEKLERTLKQASTTEEIISIFNQIKLVKINHS